MELLMTVFHAVALVVPVVTLLVLWYRRKGIEIDHIFLFSTGFIFYLVLSYTLAKSSFFSVYVGSPSYPVWKASYDLVTQETWAWYLASLVFLYCAFIAGSWLAVRRSSSSVRVRNPIDPVATNIFFAITMGFIAVFGYQLRDHFFWSYQKSTQISVFSSFVAASILLISVTACVVIYRYHSGKSLRRSLLHPAVASYGVVAILLLSMGGRVIVVSSLLMIVIFYSVYVHRLRLSTSIAFFVFLVILSHIVILWRMGFASEILNPKQYYNVRGLEIALFSENFNVSYSLMDFLAKYPIPLIRFPLILFSNFIGLMPSFIFPDKSAWILDVSSIGYTIGSPSGGFNAYVSLMVNFGIIGSSLFLFGLSYFLQRLRQYQSTIAIAMYVLLSGWLAAMFFRDFGQTVIKQMFQFSVLMPLALLVLSRIITNKRKHSVLV
ncbi:hypothetical protein HZA86_00355 [Candidatus Uhrbacteria bacterium]|nr:hypothetical protein [Candidatus Uhrbacteria bacterium]